MSARFQLNQYSVQVNGIRLCVRSTQQSTKPVLYCLHGGPGFGSESLISGILPLASVFDLRFVDLRGNGASSDPADRDYSLNAYRDDIAALIAQERNARAVGVLGHSFGGLVAIQLLATVSLDFGILCSAPFDTGYQGEFTRALQSGSDPELSRTQREFDGESATDKDFRAMEVGAKSIYFPELDLQKALEMMSPWTYRVAPFRYASQKIMSSFDLTGELRSIGCPCLIIGGSRDLVISARYLERYKGLIPQGSVRVIEGAGHFPFITEQDQFSKQVSQWWEVSRSAQREK